MNTPLVRDGISQFIPPDSRVQGQEGRAGAGADPSIPPPQRLCFLLTLLPAKGKRLGSAVPKMQGAASAAGTRCAGKWHRLGAGMNPVPHSPVLCVFLLASPSYLHGGNQHHPPSSPSVFSIPSGCKPSSRAFLVSIRRREKRGSRQRPRIPGWHLGHLRRSPGPPPARQVALSIT